MALRKQSWLSAQTLCAGTSFDHPLLNDEASVCGRRIIWNTEDTSSFKSLLKHKSFVFSEEQIFELGSDFSVPLSSVCSSETSCTQPHFTHALPHAAHKEKKCLKLNWALQIRRPCRCHLHWRLCCSSKSLWSGSMQQSGVTACSYKTAVMLMFFTMLAWALCLFKFLTEILIYHTFILYFSTVSAPVDFFFQRLILTSLVICWVAFLTD